MCWRLIVERVATLEALESHWSLDDVMDANDAMDALEEARARGSKG
jgi:hypothetical protein